ncbi:Uncharacterized protein HZ326_28157 [Fusarium oxysporum f. sp. albedinis]|nr:Uncharacterized protein HZ326_28157 [Fusarium oxysporum f. sp. albedinis]
MSILRNRKQKEVWQSSWSPSNSIPPIKHIHEFFDARLFSAHPHALRIRVFVPSDALRHHYDMSRIENKTADRPILDAISLSIRWWVAHLRDSDGTIPTKAVKGDISINWKRLREMVHSMRDWEPRLVNSMVVMIPKQKFDVR